MHSGAQIEGLKAASFGVAVGEAGLDLVENVLVGCDSLALHERAALFEHLANLFSAWDLADTYVAGVICDDDKVSREEGGVGSAEIEEHGVVACDGNDPHGGDDGGFVSDIQEFEFLSGEDFAELKGEPQVLRLRPSGFAQDDTSFELLLD
jgi:hypothetical protein